VNVAGCLFSRNQKTSYRGCSRTRLVLSTKPLFLEYIQKNSFIFILYMNFK